MLPPLVADVNVASQVVQFLRSQGVDVVSACEEGWGSYEDENILAVAYAMDRFVLTHDSDFGTLAVYLKHPTTGIIHLRPGGRPSTEVIADLQDLLNMQVDWTPPLIAVYQSGHLRLRRL